MDSKLSIIEQAKAYAKAKNISLSRLIENYLQAVVAPNEKMEISPLVKSLTGLIDFKGDEKSAYRDFLGFKYKCYHPYP